MKTALNSQSFFSSINIIALLFFISSCNKFTEDRKPTLPVKDSLSVEKEPKVPEYIITYHIDSLINEVQIDSFETNYSTEEKKIIFGLNRIDPGRLKVGSKLLIPDSLMADFNKYSPFPKELNLLNQIPKSVLISQRIQGFALYEHGMLVKWGPVSTGKLSTPTPNGLNYGNYKAKKKVSTVNEDWLLPYYFNFMNFEGVGVHQYALPGYPASHACVRLRMSDAQFIYDWAQQWKLNKNGNRIAKNGTPFMVFGEYDYGKSVPWHNLALNEKDNNLKFEEIDVLRAYVYTYLKDERNFEEVKEPENMLAAK